MNFTVFNRCSVAVRIPMIRFGRHRKSAVDSKGESTKTGGSDKILSANLLLRKDATSQASGSKFDTLCSEFMMLTVTYSLIAACRIVNSW
ncbi:hypothetical protein T09_2822 [Trichinella sp. T9]|nr:hypothetical protein T09_2822 [Trichinella sp. T9]